MQVQHYEFILIREVDKLIDEFETLKKEDLIHFREKLAELVKQNDRMAMLYHLSAKELFHNSDVETPV